MPTHISSGICKNQQIVFMGWIACNRRGYYCSELFVYHCRVMARLLLHVMARLLLQVIERLLLQVIERLHPGVICPGVLARVPPTGGGVNMGPYGPRGERGVPSTRGCNPGVC